MSKDLPEGWIEATVADVTTRAPSVKPESEPARTFGYVDISAIDRRANVIRLGELRTFAGKDAPSRARRPICPGDVLFSNVRTNLRNVALVRADLPAQLCSTGFTVLRPNGAILPQFLLWWVLTDRFTEEISETQTGTHYPATSDAQVVAQPIVLGPLPEQRRIVEKVEALLEQVNQAKARLDRVALILKRFRQSVLAAACSGELTKEWRREHADVPTAAHPIDEQRKRHRTAWERWRSESPSRRASRYEAPPAAWRDNLPDLPSSWSWARLGFLGEDPLGAVQTGPFGALLHRDQFVESGIPVIAVGNLTGIGFTDDGLYFVTPRKAAELSRFDVNAGDLLFARSGATLGKVCVAPAHVRDWRMTGHILRGRLWRGAVLPEFAAFALWGSPAVLEQVSESIRGVTRPGYNTSLLEEIHLPIPPLEEQAEILRQVGGLFGLADTIEHRVQSGRMRADKLPQAILSKAFSGELVPTEAELAVAEGRTYETAEQLLSRVAALGYDQATKHKRTRRQRRSA